MEEELKFNKKVDERIRKLVPELAQSQAFSDRKLTDTPADAYQVVSRRYVTLNGPSTTRPTSSVVGQQYFDTTLASGRGKTITWNGTGFVDGTGAYV